jgi:hypothetical protein
MRGMERRWRSQARLPPSRLLLRHAMQRAESQHQIAAGNSNNFATRKKRSQRIQRHAIARISKRRNNQQLVGNIKIGITGGQPLLIEINWRRHRQRNHAQRFSCNAK